MALRAHAITGDDMTTLGLQCGEGSDECFVKDT